MHFRFYSIKWWNIYFRVQMKFNFKLRTAFRLYHVSLTHKLSNCFLNLPNLRYAPLCQSNFYYKSNKYSNIEIYVAHWRWVREFKIEYLKEKLLNSIIKNLMKSWSSKTVFKSWYKLKTWVWWEPWSHDQVQILATNMDALFYTFLCLF